MQHSRQNDDDADVMFQNICSDNEEVKREFVFRLRSLFFGCDEDAEYVTFNPGKLNAHEQPIERFRADD